MSSTASDAPTGVSPVAGPWSAKPISACPPSQDFSSDGCAQTPPLLSAVVRPNVSTAGWVKRVFFLVAIVSLVVGAFFAMDGVWIVPFIIAVEVTALGVATAHYRRSALSRRQEISVYPDRLMVVTTCGRLQDEQSLSTAWLTLERRRDGVERLELFLKVREQTLAIGGWLGAAQREELADMIDQALALARRGGRAAQQSAPVYWESRRA